jgi:hypothetical protein
MKQRILYALLALAYLIPIWAVEYLPTTDGPAHTYNAWVLRQIDNRAEYPLFDRYYVIDARPLPNWLGHAVMAGLMRAVPPRTAEKLLASGYVLLFVTGAWFLAGAVDPERRWVAFLALPMACNRFFQMGFYNFCLGLALFLVTLGFWWRRRHRPDAAFAAALTGLLLLLWISHLVAHALALIALGALVLLLALRGGPKRNLAIHLAILAPQVLLPLWFVTGREWNLEWLPHPATAVWSYFLHLQAVGAQRFWFGPVLVLAIVVFLVLSLRAWRRRTGPGPFWREEDAFLALSALFALLYFAAPDNGLDGSLLKQRLSLIPWLVLLPWLAPDFGRRSRNLVIGALAVLALAHVTFLVQGYRSGDRDVRELLAGTAPIAPDTRVLPLLFDRQVSEPRLGAIDHAFAYAALEKGLVDWNNYEAGSESFPVRFRPGVRRPASHLVEAYPEELDLAAFRDEIDYVYCWKMQPGSAFARRIERHYDLVAERGPARLYARKGWRPPGPPGSRRED